MRIAGGARTEDELLHDLCAFGLREAGSDACDLFLADGETLLLRASSGSPEFNHRVRLGKGVGVTGHAFTEG